MNNSKNETNDYNRLKNAVSATDVTAVRRLIKGGVSVNSRSAAQDWVCNLNANHFANAWLCLFTS